MKELKDGDRVCFYSHDGRLVGKIHDRLGSGEFYAVDIEGGDVSFVHRKQIRKLVKKEKKKIIDLREIRKAEIGTIVVSSKGFEFEFVSRNLPGEQIWKDKTSGLLWYPEEKERYAHKEAVNKFGDRLPTKEEFEEAERHGFREVIEFTDQWHWSASLFPDSTVSAWVFGGGDGRVYSYYRTNTHAVRCVGR